MTSGILCAATTSRGYFCINQATQGQWCPGHNPSNWCGATTASGGVCRRMKGRDGGRCSKHRRAA